MSRDTVIMEFEAVDDLSPTIKKINKELGDLDKEAQQASKSTDMAGNAIKGMLTAAAGYFTIQKLGEALKFSVKEALDGQKEQAKLEQTIKATGSAAGLTAKQVTAMAQQLQDVTTFSEGAIVTGQSLLLTFKNIGGDVFPRVTKAMLDMSASMDQDLSSSAMQLGKALNDPVEGMAALSRVGVQFTEVQKQTITKFMEQNDIASAQNVILKELESQFGGVAEAMGATDFGQWQQFKNDIADLGDAFGVLLLPALREATKLMRETAQGWTAIFNQTAKKNEEKTKQIEEVGAKMKEAAEEVKMLETAKGHNVDELYINAVERLDNLKAEFRKLTGAETGAPTAGATATPAAPKKTSAKSMTEAEINASNEAWAKAQLEQYDLRLRFQEELRLAKEKNLDAEIQAILDYNEEVRKIEAETAELQNQLREQEAESDRNVLERRKEGALIAVETMATAAQQIFDAAMTKQVVALDKETAARKKNVQESRMSERQKAKELEKIDEDARKKRYEIAMKDWRMNLVMSFVNTALGITKTISTMGMPAAIPMVIATGALGAVSSGIIAANKPEFAQGGFVPGTSFTGDKVDASVNSGEAILNTRQQREFMAIANGRARGMAGNITLGDSTVIINGNASDDTVQALKQENMNHRQAMLELLYEAKERGEIDATRLTI